MRYYLTAVRMAIIKESTNNKHLRGCWEKGTLLHCCWECKLIQPLRRSVWRFLKKIKIELLYDPEIPLLGIYPEKNIMGKDTRTSVFIDALFTIARTWKQPKYPSTVEWIKKMWHIYEMEYYIYVSDGLQPARLYCLWNSLGRNTDVCSHPHLQGIFPTQESNLDLVHCRQILYCLSQQGRPVEFTHL